MSLRSYETLNTVSFCVLAASVTPREPQSRSRQTAQWPVGDVSYSRLATSRGNGGLENFPDLGICSNSAHALHRAQPAYALKVHARRLRRFRLRGGK